MTGWIVLDAAVNESVVATVFFRQESIIVSGSQMSLSPSFSSQNIRLNSSSRSMRIDNSPPGKSRRLEQRSAALKGEGRTCHEDWSSGHQH
jgi:hypothetical protein